MDPGRLREGAVVRTDEYACLVAWSALLEQDGHVSAVRDVFDESIERLVASLVLMRPEVSNEKRVRKLMRSSLPVHPELPLYETYRILLDDGGQADRSCYGLFCWACQSLRLSLEETDEMRKVILVP